MVGLGLGCFFEIINCDKNFIENMYLLLFENFIYRFN